jgi:2-polyprenyl-6-methoxyphenol hydroxylase-like FAD-dependent oxidoreductase
MCESLESIAPTRVSRCGTPLLLMSYVCIRVSEGTHDFWTATITAYFDRTGWNWRIRGGACTEQGWHQGSSLRTRVGDQRDRCGIQIGPDTFHVFERLGITEAVRAKAAMPQRLVMMDGISGEEVVSIPLDDQFLHRFTHPYALIHRADLHRILLNARLGSDLIGASTDVKVLGFIDHGDSVTMQTTEGDV